MLQKYKKKKEISSIVHECFPELVKENEIVSVIPCVISRIPRFLKAKRKRQQKMIVVFKDGTRKIIEWPPILRKPGKCNNQYKKSHKLCLKKK